MFRKPNIALTHSNVNNPCLLFLIFFMFYAKSILIFLFLYGSLVKNR